jgi:hypothetical protein
MRSRGGRTRKSARLMANQVMVSDRDDDIGQDDYQEQHELFERERQIADEREAEAEQQENTMMISKLVAELVNTGLGEKFKCEYCGKVFRDKWNLDVQHTRVMHNPWPATSGLLQGLL